MALTLPPELVEALQYIGYDWPSSNEDILNANGDAFQSAQSVASRVESDVAAAASKVKNSNEGPTVDAFMGYFNGSESNLHSLQDFQTAAGIIADGFRLVADAVVVLKGVVIAQLIILAASIAAAIASGGLASGAVLLVKEGCKRLIDLAINVAIEKVLG